jgi:hypothetical protein
MTLFGYTLRKPWVRYETFALDIEDELMGAILRSSISAVVADIITDDLCDSECEAVQYLENVMKP